jgi:predicted transcriptional regulator
VYVTSLKLPDDLKRRIAKLAACSGQTTHAFMVDALARANCLAMRDVPPKTRRVIKEFIAP